MPVPYLAIKLQAGGQDRGGQGRGRPVAGLAGDARAQEFGEQIGVEGVGQLVDAQIVGVPPEPAFVLEMEGLGVVGPIGLGRGDNSMKLRPVDRCASLRRAARAWGAGPPGKDGPNRA